MARREPTARLLDRTPEREAWQVQWPSTCFKQGGSYRALVCADGTLQLLTWSRHKPVAPATFERLRPKVVDAIREAGGRVADPLPAAAVA